MKEPENNNYKLIFHRFLSLLPKCKKTTSREITEGLRPITEGIENLPQTITFPAFPSIQAFEKPPEGEENMQYIGAVANKYLRKFATRSEADTTYGLYDRNGNFYIGNKPVVIIDNNIVVDDEEYAGTPGLCELCQKIRTITSIRMRIITITRG